jgi:hypothetical protein
VRDLCDGVLPSSQAARLIDVCRNIEHQADARIIAGNGARITGQTIVARGTDDQPS